MALRKEFSKEMNELHNDMIRLGSLVENALCNAQEAVFNYDIDLAEQVVAGDDEIDKAAMEINKSCVLLIARQQPVASDLRDITANLKLSTDLERMADHAEDICKHLRYMIAGNQRLRLPRELERMFDETKKMTALSLDAYVSRDNEKALKVIKMDNTIDELYALVFADLSNQMKHDTMNIDGYLNLLMIAKHIERTADHAENVAEWVMYYLEGAFDFFEDKHRDSEDEN